MLTFLGEVEELLGDLYPYRYPLTLFLLAAAAAGLNLLGRLGVYGAMWRHRLLSGAVLLPLLAATAVAGQYLLSPLWERSFLEEASPLAEAAPDQPQTVTPVLAESAQQSLPVLLKQGTFQGADDFHFGRGDALIIRDATGKHLLRFESFSVRNGPDLYVYISRAEDPSRAEESLNLGRLKATDGAFNYELPDGVHPDEVRSVLVWCRQFGVLFAIARLP